MCSSDLDIFSAIEEGLAITPEAKEVACTAIYAALDAATSKDVQNRDDLMARSKERIKQMIDSASLRVDGGDVKIRLNGPGVVTAMTIEHGTRYAAGLGQDFVLSAVLDAIDGN